MWHINYLYFLKLHVIQFFIIFSLNKFYILILTFRTSQNQNDLKFYQVYLHWFYLDVNDWSICIAEFPSTSCTSSTLIKLKVNAATFDDCLCILDGRLKCLSTLIIHVDHILLYSSNRNKVTIIWILIFWRETNP